MLSFSLPEMDKKNSCVFKKDNIKPVDLNYFNLRERQRPQCNLQVLRGILWNHTVLLLRESHKLLVLITLHI